MITKYLHHILFSLCLVNMMACHATTNPKHEEVSKESEIANQKVISKALKCSWIKHEDFLNNVNNKVRECRDNLGNTFNEKDHGKIIKNISTYKNCIIKIIEEFKINFYSEKVNNFDIENFKQGVKNIETSYDEIYCRAFMCDESWKVIAIGDSSKIYEDFLRNIFNIIMIDMSGPEPSCQDKRDVMLKEFDLLVK